MNVDPISIRRPRPGYEGRNEFSKGPTEPEEINDSNLYEALDNHRRALYVINYKKCPVPTYVPSFLCQNFQRKLILIKHSLEEMKAELAKDDLSRIKDRMKILREEHLKDLERLYSFHAQDYRQEVMDRYLSLEEGQGGEIDGKNLTPAEIRFQVSNLFLFLTSTFKLYITRKFITTL